MPANQFGKRFSLTTFGESHGVALGAIIDGCPSGVIVDVNAIQQELGRRRPGGMQLSSEGIVSARNEQDQVEVLSGVFDGRTIGTPIAMIVRNTDQRSEDYDKIMREPRIGHADDVWKNKYLHVDYRGGGRSSGRETIGRVLGGSIAKMMVTQLHPLCEVVGFSFRIGPYQLEQDDYNLLSSGVYLPDDFSARFPSPRNTEVRDLLVQARAQGESYGGVAEVWIKNPPMNLGQPVFHKFKSDLAQALLSVGASTGVEFGEGFEATSKAGTQFHLSEGSQAQYGGIRGGITTGELISMKVAFKPTSSILDTAKQGRHDPCIVIRAIPVLESMAWLCLADHILWSRQDRL